MGLRRDRGPDLIDNGILIQKLIRIAIPIAIQGVVSATLSLVDGLMVGRLGEPELAAVGIAIQIFIIHYLFLFGFNSGTATFTSQFYGKGDYSNIKKILGLAITLGLVIAVVFFIPCFFFPQYILRIYSSDPAIIELAVPYVRIAAVTVFFAGIASPIETTMKATQQTKYPMIVSLIVFFINVTLNYTFIFGNFGAPRMGVGGAALATAIARGVQAVVDLAIIQRKDTKLGGSLKEYFGWDPDLVKRVAKNSFPTTINEVFWALGFSMYNAAFSRLGTTAYASFQAADTIRSIFAFTAFSVGDAALILVGEKLGEGDRDAAIELSRKMLVIGAIVGGSFGLLLIACAWPMVNLFALTPLGKTYAFRILIVIGLTMMIGILIGMCTTGILRGGGDTRYAAAGELSCMWIIGVPLAFFGSLVLHLPIYLAFLLLKVNDIVTLAVMLIRVKSNKWANTMIRGL